MYAEISRQYKIQNYFTTFCRNSIQVGKTKNDKRGKNWEISTDETVDAYL